MFQAHPRPYLHDDRPLPLGGHHPVPPGGGEVRGVPLRDKARRLQLQAGQRAAAEVKKKEKHGIYHINVRMLVKKNSLGKGAGLEGPAIRYYTNHMPRHFAKNAYSNLKCLTSKKLALPR